MHDMNVSDHKIMATHMMMSLLPFGVGGVTMRHGVEKISDEELFVHGEREVRAGQQVTAKEEQLLQKTKTTWGEKQNMEICEGSAVWGLSFMQYKLPAQCMRFESFFFFRKLSGELLLSSCVILIQYQL